MKALLRFICFLLLFSILFSCIHEKEKEGNSEIGLPVDNIKQVVQRDSLPGGLVPFKFDNIDSTNFDFHDFLNLFGKTGIEDAGLPDFLVKRFIETDSLESPGIYFLVEAISVDSFYLVFFRKYVLVGPGVDYYHAKLYNGRGKPISDVKIGESYPSVGPGGGGRECKYRYDNDHHLIRVTNHFIGWDETRQMETLDVKNSYFVISMNGINELLRKYQFTSEKLLSHEELKSYSKEELKLMRNEIFASYGYIFKKEPYKSYFGAMIWYEPMYDNVDLMLSRLEKENIERIKQAEALK